MSSVNKVILIGHLGKDPECKTLQNGAVANFSLATSEKFKDKQGQQKEKTEWHNITLWSKLAELAGRYLKKGSQIYLEGRLQTRSWENDAGVKQYRTEIIGTSMTFLGSPGGQGSGGQRNDPRNEAPPSGPQNGPDDNFDDSVPF